MVIGDFDSLSEEGKVFLEIHEKGNENDEIPYGGMIEWKAQKGFGNEIKEIKVLPLEKIKNVFIKHSDLIKYIK